MGAWFLQESGMPTYDYRNTATGAVVTVRHRMSEKAQTWGELCALGDLDPGSTPRETPVERVLTTGGVVGTAKAAAPPMPPCGMGGCGGGMCQFQ